MKELDWIGSSYKDLLSLPRKVIRVFGFALHRAQEGKKHSKAKVLHGLGTGVIEVIEDDSAGTYRAVYTVRFDKVVYVLHCFQKKSKSGIKTPKEDIELIKQRLKEAKDRYESIK